MTPSLCTLEEIGALVARHRFRFQSEADIQRGLATVLDAAGIDYRREVALAPGDRIDFLVDGGLGIEVKVDGSELDLSRQLLRYAQHDAVSTLLVVTTRARHTRAPRELGGKSIRVLHLIGSML